MYICLRTITYIHTCTSKHVFLRVYQMYADLHVHNERLSSVFDYIYISTFTYMYLSVGTGLILIRISRCADTYIWVR